MGQVVTLKEKKEKPPKKEPKEKPVKEGKSKSKTSKDSKDNNKDANGNVVEQKQTDSKDSKTTTKSLNGNSKSGSASTAKVRPMTPSQAAASENIPKPVAFEITVDEKTKKLTNVVINDGESIRDKIIKGVGSLVGMNGGGGNSGANNGNNTLSNATQTNGNQTDVTTTTTTNNTNNNDDETPLASDPSKLQARFPRRLPKLSSLGKSWSTNQEQKTNEEIIQKQKKAEEKRNEILEGCKGFFRRTILATMSLKANQQKLLDSGADMEIYKGYLDIYKCNNSIVNHNPQNNGDGQSMTTLSDQQQPKRCPILVEQNRRRCCKSCRFKKCIDAGMKYEPSALEPKLKRLDPLDIIFYPETLNFQRQLYHSYAMFIDTLMSQFRIFLRLINNVKDYPYYYHHHHDHDRQSCNPNVMISMRQRSALIIMEYLAMLTDEMLTKFISYMDDFRQIHINNQADLIHRSKHWLLCMILAAVYPTAEKSLNFNGIIFGEQTFHNNLCELYQKLKILGNVCSEDDDKNDEQQQEQPQQQQPQQQQPQQLNSTSLTMTNTVDIKTTTTTATNNECQFLGLLLSNQNSFQNICHRAFLKSRKFQKSHLSSQQNQSPKSFNSFEFYHIDNTIPQQSPIIMMMDDRKWLLSLKEKYRFLPLLTAMLLIRNYDSKTIANSSVNCRTKPAETNRTSKELSAIDRIRYLLMTIMRNEYQLFERITGYSNNMENVCTIFAMPNNNNNNKTIGNVVPNLIGMENYPINQNTINSFDVFNRFTLSRLANNFEDVTRIIGHLVSIVRLKFSILI
ncbi:hypothetical protein DERP_003107 [Dermatophagoides pteronyssinus]|uniref:Nuclear receptor domain-containing protein n=1 Tax=Dermatophagoides pteronyssinus TaxID=6956 RepID=A0ABQ8JIJ4_DERPT|nr:hypothetical protein DERP_003107 [Dermatophagoides pteronyssinus]